MTKAANSHPASIWEALRRLLNCNKSQLAAHLGINRRTLQRWENGEESEAAREKSRDLLTAILETTPGAEDLTRLRHR